jgi:hypothetical protein
MGQIFPDYEEKFPNIANILKELPNLKDEISPHATAHRTTTFELFNNLTYNEYHCLFTKLMK